MPYIAKITVEKARRINQDPSIYGAFAEIGAGQEVVNHFFKAGRASQSVAKSMSAYDMIFSDEIYGKAGRYVSKKRLIAMLDHEYTLLEKRLKKKRGHNTRFFAFADTVAVGSWDRLSHAHHHGWMGIRFQNTYGSPYNEIILHINLLDNTRLQQHEMLGALGVNLIHSAFYGSTDYKSIIKALFDNFESSRVDIDVLTCSGHIFKKLDHQQMNLELIKQKSTQALLFQHEGKSLLPSDALYEKPILVQPEGLSAHMSKKALAYIKGQKNLKQKPILLFNVPFQQFKKHKLSVQNRISDLIKKHKQEYILISHFNQLYELKDFLRKATDQPIFLFLNKDWGRIVNSLKKLSHEEVLVFFSRLCDSKTVLLVPEECRVLLPSPFSYLENYLTKTKNIIYLK